MKKALHQIFKWSIPALLGAFGLFLWLFVSGHSFLGVISCGIAAVIVCYYLLSALKKTHAGAAKAIRVIFSTLLVLGILAYAITLVPIIRAATPQADADCEYIVVLGAKVNGQSPSLSLKERIDAAYDYLSAHPQTVAIVSGGQGPDEGISEAQCMYNELTKMGIEGSRIWLEDKSTSTQENLNFSLTLIEEKTGTRPDAIGLISSEYHIFRATLVAEEHGVEAVGIPASTSWLTLKLNYYLREVAALWYYLVF